MGEWSDWGVRPFIEEARYYAYSRGSIEASPELARMIAVGNIARQFNIKPSEVFDLSPFDLGVAQVTHTIEALRPSRRQQRVR